MTMDTLALTDTLSDVGLAGAPPPSAEALLDRHESFADMLGRASRSTDEPPERRARRAAEQLVSAAFIQPMLAQIRDHSQAAPPFAPTQGEKQFRALTDAKLAHDIVRSARLPIVERITRDLLERARAGASVEATPDARVEGVR